MGKHSKRQVGAGRTVAATTFGAVLTTIISPAAGADEVDDLIQKLETVSHEVSTKSEQMKVLEDEIGAAEGRISQLSKDADVARGEAERANGERAGFQQNLNGIAQSRYRNTNNEILLSTLESGSPQAAIDRAAYLSTLSRNAERTISGLNQASRDANARTDAVLSAVAEAQRTRDELNAKRGQLERERKDLEAQVKDLESKVDSLSPESRQRWVNKDNPIDPAVINVPGAGSGVVASAMAQVGKPYGWGATGPNAFDCSGLMVYSYAQNGKSIPRTSQAQLAGGTPVPLNQLQPGDIIGYYPGTTHVGMYIGDGMIVHASDYGIPVQVVAYNSMPISGAVRY